MMKHPGVPTRWLSALVLLAACCATPSVFAQLNLNVNRVSGVVSISNPTASPIAINGYSILSAYGALKPANGQWNSLDDQNTPTGEWFESAPTPTDLNELNPLGSSTLAAGGGSLPLGTPYTHIIPALGLNPDHLTFEYNVFGGSATTQGTVVYSGGTKIENNIILQVNETTGQVQLKNDSPYDVFLDGYAVRSASGSLQPQDGKWFSLKDRGVTGWDEATPTGFVVTELKNTGAMRLTPGSGYGLGELFFPAGGGIPDLSVEFLQPGNLDPTLGKVLYGSFTAATATSAGVLADFNSSGTVDAADYALWRKASGTNTVLRNDPIGGTIGTAQYNLWKANFGNSTAGGAGAVLANVPEPSSILLLITALCALAWRRDEQRPKSC